MIIAQTIAKMIHFLQGNQRDINHFLTVWGYARTIGRLEGLDDETQQALEVAAIVHDIGCPYCRLTYGSIAGPLQEKEGAVIAADFLADMGLAESQTARVCHMVGHHHTVRAIDGIDLQILIEADFLVNASEGQMKAEAVERFRDEVFRTPHGIALLNSIFLKKGA